MRALDRHFIRASRPWQNCETGDERQYECDATWTHDCSSTLFSGSEILGEADRIHVAEYWRQRRKLRRGQEVDVEAVLSERRTVDGRAALVRADCLPVVEEHGDR